MRTTFLWKRPAFVPKAILHAMYLLTNMSTFDWDFCYVQPSQDDISFNSFEDEVTKTHHYQDFQRLSASKSFFQTSNSPSLVWSFSYEQICEDAKTDRSFIVCFSVWATPPAKSGCRIRLVCCLLILHGSHLFFALLPIDGTWNKCNYSISLMRLAYTPEFGCA